jgi:hypothetical protein
MGIHGRSRPIGRPRSRREENIKTNSRTKMAAWTGMTLHPIGRGRSLL